MAGFLAPQISDIGPAPGGQGAVVDTSVGDALVGVSRIFDAAFPKGGGSGPTQTDRDNAALQPFLARVQQLEAQREQLGPQQFNARLNAAFSSFAVGNGALINEAKTGITAITGIEVGEKELDVASELQQSAIEFLTKDPEGISMAPGLLVYDDNGELDNELTILNAMRAQAQASADDAELARLKVLAEKESAISGINETRMKGVVDEWLLRSGAEAQTRIEAVIRGAIASGFTFEDSGEVIMALRRDRGFLATRFNAKALEGGFANHPDWQVDKALVAYDTLIDTLTANVELVPKLFAAIEAADQIALGEVISGATGGAPGSYQRKAFEFFLQGFVAERQVDIEAAVMGLGSSPTMDSLVDAPLFGEDLSPVSPESPPSPTGATTTEADTASRGLSEAQRVEEVEKGVANFGSFEPVNKDNEEYRSTAVTAFTLASSAMNTSAQPVAEATFNKMYDAKFFDTYNTITRYGDESSARLQAAVNKNLATVFEQRKGLAEKRISNDLASTMPGLGLTFRDGVVVADISGFGGEQEKALVAALKANSLPVTLEGVIKLREVVRSQLLGVSRGGPDNSAILDLDVMSLNEDIMGEVQKEVGYMNKIIGTLNRLPDLAQYAVPNLEKSMARVPVIDSLEKYNEIFPALKEGDRYTVVGTNGQLTTMVKGSENLVFGGAGGPE